MGNTTDDTLTNEGIFLFLALNTASNTGTDIYVDVTNALL